MGAKGTKTKKDYTKLTEVILEKTYKKDTV